MTRLTREMQVSGTPPSFRQLVFANLGWLLVSLGLAVIVWYLAASTQNPIVQQRLGQRRPIDILVPEGYIVMQRSADSTQVTLRTLQTVWNEIAPEDVRIVADFRNVQLPAEGQTIERTVPLQGMLLNGRRGTVVDISPTALRVTLALRGEKLVTVNIIPAQEPPVGFVALEITPSERQVKVIGAKAIVDEVIEARATVNLQEQTASFVRNLTLTPLNADGQPVEGVVLTPTDLTVKVTIQERDDVTGLLVVPSYTGTLPDGYQLIRDVWSPKRIFVRGDPQVIVGMNGTIPTEPIDLSGHTNSFTQSVQLRLPVGVTMPDPTDISITVTIEPVLITREITGILVQPQGLDPADYDIAVKPDRVRVRVTGPQAVVAALSETDISVYAPLTGLGAGRHTVTLLASIAAPELGATSVEIPESEVEVSIVARNPTPTPTLAPTRTATSVLISP